MCLLTQHRRALRNKVARLYDLSVLKGDRRISLFYFLDKTV